MQCKQKQVRGIHGEILKFDDLGEKVNGISGNGHMVFDDDYRNPSEFI